MGRSLTPTFRIEFAAKGFRADALTMPIRADSKAVSLMSWNKHYGRPTVANLDKWVQTMNDSFKAGGINATLKDKNGNSPNVYWARIVRQATNAVVAEVGSYKAP
jgi:hypothetical protein